MPLSVSEAEAELSKAITLEREIAAELTTLEKQRSESETGAGEKCLAARKVGDQKAIQKINDEVLRLRQRCDVARATHQAAREEIKQARREINMARGRDLRARAAEILKEVATRQTKTDELLSALQEHEGIRYLAEPQLRGGVYLAGSFNLTKTQRMAQDAELLIRQAETTENQIVTVEPAPSTTGRKSGAILV